ncbi:hypothetical protein [Actinocorallia libanotica]|uniref:hypothetical protein n=1 Tax=Actinocorallia libanotica TaxID=46162 RepID=UPI0031D854C0
MTSVVLLGDFPTVGLRGAAMAARTPLTGPGPAAAHDLAERLAPLLDGGRAALVLYPSWRERTDLPVLRMARSLLDARRLAFGEVPLPPLALSFVADQCAHLAPHVEPGVLTSLLPRLARAVAAGAWVSSVARLAHVRTGLRQHMRSYLPRAGFLVTASPVQEVRRTTGEDPLSAWPGRLIGPVLMLAADQQGDPAWVNDALRTSLDARSVSLTPPQPASAAYWGTPKFTEFVAWSGHAQAMQILVRGMSCRPCPWCGEPTGLPVCAFCRAAQPPGTAVPQPDLPDLWTTAPPPAPEPAPPLPVPAPPVSASFVPGPPEAAPFVPGPPPTAEPAYGPPVPWGSKPAGNGLPAPEAFREQAPVPPQPAPVPPPQLAAGPPPRPAAVPPGREVVRQDEPEAQDPEVTRPEPLPPPARPPSFGSPAVPPRPEIPSHQP